MGINWSLVTGHWSLLTILGGIVYYIETPLIATNTIYFQNYRKNLLKPIVTLLQRLKNFIVTY